MILFYRCVAWGLVAAIAVFTLSPMDVRPVTGVAANFERFVAFVALGVAFGLGYPTKRIGSILLVISIAGFLEVSQLFVAGRHARVSDGVIKACAAAFGVLTAIFLRPTKSAEAVGGGKE